MMRVLPTSESYLFALEDFHLKIIRDCASASIMMDGHKLFPDGFHPSAQYLSPERDSLAKSIPRICVSTVKYYFIDFSISEMFDKSSTEPRLTSNHFATEKEAPELMKPELHDPFILDVFVLGKVYQRSLLDVSSFPLHMPSRPTEYTFLDLLESWISDTNGGGDDATRTEVKNLIGSCQRDV